MIGIVVMDPRGASASVGIPERLEEAGRAGIRTAIVVVGAGTPDAVTASLLQPAMFGLCALATVSVPVSAGAVEGLLAAAPFVTSECCCVITGDATRAMIERAIMSFYGSAAGRTEAATLVENDASFPAGCDLARVLVCSRGTLGICEELQPRRPGRVDFEDVLTALEARGALERMQMQPAQEEVCRGPIRLAA